jgi:dihydroorotase
MSVRPARIGALTGHGRPIAVGEPANLVLFDPSHRSPVDATASASLSRNNPYESISLPGQVIATFLRGRPTVLDTKLAQ